MIGRLIVILSLICAPFSVFAQEAEKEEVKAQEQDEAKEVEEVSEEMVAEEAEPNLETTVFDDGLAAFHEQDWVEAASLFYGYLKFGGANAENREWAQFFLAESLAGLGLWHGAIHYYSIVAKTRSRPEILPQAIARIEAIQNERPVDERLVYQEVIYDSEFGTIPQHLNDFINYMQGLIDYRNGYIRWGENHFKNISDKSVYAIRAQYVRAVYALTKKQDDKAIVLFDMIIESPIEDADMKNKAHLALARLLFDMHRYADALKEYDKVQQTELSFEQAQLLLEKAWAAYYIKEPRRALGYLHALGAPSYKQYFLPDIYLIRALILKELCHYIPAKRALRSFRFHFGDGIEQLERRVPLAQAKVIFDGATQQGPISRRTAFIQNLEKEREKIEDYESTWEPVELDKELKTLYDLTLKEQGRLWRREFTGHADVIARELLDAAEQIELLDYEVGLDIFKRLKADTARTTMEEQLVVPYDSANVYYEFDTEYWNDELHSYEVFVTNRCFEEVEGQQ
ncbi:MAG: hypothetical protein JW841_08335 [Deltaproteobacteria bacterium]|nr:hypothetical protein [Deltaproteobacteria bacterium]